MSVQTQLCMGRLTIFLTMAAASTCVAVGCCLPDVAVAATPTWLWSESYAESVVLAKVRIPCWRIRNESDCSVTGAQKEIATYNSELAGCKALGTSGDPSRAVGCLENLMNQRDP